MSAHEQLRCIYTPYECKLSVVCGLETSSESFFSQLLTSVIVVP